MRQLFTTTDAEGRGFTRPQLRTGEWQGRWTRVIRGVYAEGSESPSALDRARASVLAAGGEAAGTLGAVLRGLDGVALGDDAIVTVAANRSHTRPGTRRREPDPEATEIAQVRCAGATRILLDLAEVVDDAVWEQALESALRRRLTTLDALAGSCGRHQRGSERVRRVLAARPAGAPPTESMLETLFVQLARLVPGLAPPVRQYRVRDAHGREVARVDLCWPELGLFIELDGQHHRGQPLYDARPMPT
jgi:hypothetical protein